MLLGVEDGVSVGVVSAWVHRRPGEGVAGAGGLWRLLTVVDGDVGARSGGLGGVLQRRQFVRGCYLLGRV